MTCWHWLSVVMLNKRVLTGPVDHLHVTGQSGFMILILNVELQDKASCQ